MRNAACLTILFCTTSLCAQTFEKKEAQIFIAQSGYAAETFTVGGFLDATNTRTKLWNTLSVGYEPLQRITVENKSAKKIKSPRVIANHIDYYDKEKMLSHIFSSCLTLQDSLLAAYTFVKEMAIGRMHPDGEAYDEYKMLFIYGYATCSAFVKNICAILQAVNIPSEEILLTHHHTMQAVVDGKEYLLDGNENVFYKNYDNKSLVGLSTVFNDKYLIKRTAHLGRREVWGDNYERSIFTSRVYDEMNTIPYATYGDGSYNFDFALKPNEKLVFDYQEPKLFHDLHELMPVEFTDFKDVVLNNLHIYSQNFTTQQVDLMDVVDNILNISNMGGVNHPNLHPLTNQKGEFILKVALPFPILTSDIKMILRQATQADSIAVYYSTDSVHWETIYKSNQTGCFMDSISLYDQIAPLGGGDADYWERSALYKYYLKFEFTPKGSAWACGIDSLNIQTVFQCSRFFAPQLKLGENTIEYSDANGADPDRNVAVTVEWRESWENKPPNKIMAPVFPAHQSDVDSLYFAFRWEPATDDDGDEIVDYEFMLSSDNRMLYPHAPNFEKYISSFDEHNIRPYFKVGKTGWLNDGETYYWRVRAKDEHGAWSDWSDTWSFTPHGTMRPVNGKAEIKGQAIHLSWARNPAGKQPDFYKIYASNETNGFSPEAASFEAPTFFGYCDTTHLVIPFKKDEAPESFYRIAACDAQGQESLASDVIAIPYPYIYSAFDTITSTMMQKEGFEILLLSNMRYYPFIYYHNLVTYYLPNITILTKPEWLIYEQPDRLYANDAYLDRKLLFMDSLQRSVQIHMDDYAGGVATQTLVIETAAKNSKPKLTLKENVFCTQNAYKGFVTSVDGDVAFGDTNYYTVLQKPSWLSYSIAGDTVRLWGNMEVSTRNDLFIKLLAVDSKNDSAIADFQINARQLYILSASTDTAVEDQRYAHQIQFSRLPNEPTFSFIRLPGWLQMDEQHRLVGTPQIHDLSDTLVHFTVSDRQCPVAAEHRLAIHIEHVNHAPVITTARLPAAYEGESYSAQVRAFDVDRLVEDPELRYTLVPSWSWLSIDAQTGMLSGEPLAQHVGDTVFQITVQDKQGERDTKTFTVPFAVLKLSSYTACASKAYEGYIAPTDGEAYRYTVLQKPSWMDYAITGDSIHLRGNANMSASGSDDVTISILAVNSRNDSIAASFSMRILEPLQILSPVADTATEDQPYAHQIQFNRPPGKLTFSFTRLPGWLQQDGKSRLYGTPRIQHLSDTLVHFTVSDSQCSVEAEYALTIHVAHVNHAPAITTAHLPAAYEGKEYSARVSAADVDSLIEDVGLQYTLIPAWSWLSINPQTGLLSGVPLGQHLGDTVFHFIVQDRQGGSDAKTFSIAVVGDNITGVEKDAAWPGKKLTCQIFQPAAGKLHYAKIQAEEEVMFQYYIYNTAGYLIYASPRQKLGSGVRYLPIDLQRQPADVYIFVGVENGTLQHAIKFVNNH